MPNVTAALPNIGDTLCSTTQSLADSHRVPCSNAAKTRNPLKFTGMPQTPEWISAVRGPKLRILREHVEEVLLLNKFFPIVDICLSSEKSSTKLCDGDETAIFCIIFAFCISSEPVQHISDLNPKFALRPHRV